ncbi:MAG: ABC transporter permease subunit [Spirochaetales bacterium]|nr:ABC transporter permease subunit [Spirochaetales bacterium]MCF7937276.1 ABC transporter permease subunit [Spirochaetales bacterium]
MGWSHEVTPSKRLLHGRNRIVRRLIWVVVIIAGYEIIRRGLEISPLALPPIVEIGSAFFAGFGEGDLLQQLVRSLILIAAALAAGAGAALGLALLSVRRSFFAELIDGLVAIFHPLPGIALLPIVILWFGTGTASLLVIIIHSVLWPMITNLTAGLRGVSPTQIMAGKNLGMGRSELFFRILLPASLPYIIAGMRIAWARSWRALISAEMVFGAIAGAGGIGWYLYSKRVFMDSAGLFAGVVLIILIGVLVEDVVFRRIQRKTVERWGMER